MPNRLEGCVASAFYGNFANATDAQKAAIESLLSGRNLILTAGTGSGKTEAVTAPIVSKFYVDAIRLDGLFLIYIAPTKALVNDLEKRLQPILQSINLRIGIRHGDKDDLKKKKSPHILITTPESLEVLLLRRDPAIKSVKAVVIDEVHLLYNTQRGLQLAVSLRRLAKLSLRPVQIAALSATVGNLIDVANFIFGENNQADLLCFPANREIDAQIRYAKEINDFVTLVQRLMADDARKFLVFVNSRRECELLAGELKKSEILREYVFAHYSSLSPEVRRETEITFAEIERAICVATNTLELGIDIGDIDAVLLWGIPISIESFVQKIGRGSRRSNKTNVICIIPPESKSPLMDALRFAAFITVAIAGHYGNQKPFELYGAVGQQCLCIVKQNNGHFTRIRDLCDSVQYRSYINRELIEEILAHLSEKEYLKHHDYKNSYGADAKLHQLVDRREIYGNFGLGSEKVPIIHGSKHMGDIPAENLDRIRTGIIVRYAGRSWRICNFSKNGIFLEPYSPSSKAVDFKYGGSSLPTDFHNINHVWHLIHSDETDFNWFTKSLRPKIKVFLEKIKQSCNYNQIPFMRNAGGFKYFTFAGTLVNKAIALSTNKDISDISVFSLLTSSEINWHTISPNPEDYTSYLLSDFHESMEQSIFQRELPLQLQLHEFLQPWLKDDDVPNILKRLATAEPVEISFDIESVGVDN